MITQQSKGNVQHHLSEKSWLKVLFVNLLREKNTVEWLTDSADKLKQTCSNYDFQNSTTSAGMNHELIMNSRIDI
jgi:hypothetical protein